MINLSHRFTQIFTDYIRLTKTKINPLRLMQVSYETWMAQPSGNP